MKLGLWLAQLCWLQVGTCMASNASSPNNERSLDYGITALLERCQVNNRLSVQTAACINYALEWCGIITAFSHAAGTTVGAGILAVPFTTQESGFIPSTASLIGTYIFSIVTGLLLAEANINLMCELGKVGKLQDKKTTTRPHAVFQLLFCVQSALQSLATSSVGTMSRVESLLHQFQGRPWGECAKRLPP